MVLEGDSPHLFVGNLTLTLSSMVYNMGLARLGPRTVILTGKPRTLRRGFRKPVSISDIGTGGLNTHPPVGKGAVCLHTGVGNGYVCACTPYKGWVPVCMHTGVGNEYGYA